jgi:hypothetical protein
MSSRIPEREVMTGATLDHYTQHFKDAYFHFPKYFPGARIIQLLLGSDFWPKGVTKGVIQKHNFDHRPWRVYYKIKPVSSRPDDGDFLA